MKKCNLLFIVLALLFSGINLVSINAEVNVVENVEVLETEMTEEKVYSSYSLNDEFSDDKVVVVIFTNIVN